MSEINWGIIGLGKIANKFALGFKDLKNAKLLSVASRNKKNLNGFQSKFNLNNNFCYTNYEELLLNFFQNFFSEYAMIINNEQSNIINKFRDNMKDLNRKKTILLPNGKKEIVFIKNLNLDGSLLIEKEGKQESIFSARIKDDFN